MAAITVAVLLLSIFDVHVAQRSCVGKHCDPNWTPFDNMVAALRGYNIRSGNPIQNNGDPGFLGQIFLPTKLNALGRVELESGITASELSSCQRTMNSRSFTTIDSYRKFVTQTSSSGVNLQIGTDTEVTAGVNLKGAQISATKTIPKPFERSWGDSRNFKELTTFFSKKQGMISTSMGTCTMYEMRLDRFHLPPFTEPFKQALIRLYDAKNKLVHTQRSLFRLFIADYGTHFLLKTKMGAQYVYRTKFSKYARQTLDSTVLQNCNYVKGAKVFGIQVEKSRSGCTTTDEQKYNSLGSLNVQSSIITKGSRPTDIEKWATQQFTPVPLQFTLSPIINLMKDLYINNAKLKGSDGKPVSALEIRKWFVPLYFDYCKSMQIADCGEKSGCGVNDKCPLDAICEGTGKVHYCGEWSQWTCTVKCGQGTKQRRTRTCVGCKGSEQFRNFKCAPQKECRKPIKCHMKYTQWNSEGGGRVEYLDRHLVNCGNGFTINSFHLVRDQRGNYRYNYQCCNTPFSCTLKTLATPGNIWGGKGGVYLDRHSLSCHNQYMSSFKLYRKAHYIWYYYSCCEMPYPKSCYSGYTGWTYDGGGNGNTYYLDRQRVSCRNGYGFAGFHLVRSGDQNHWRYNYRCCKTS